MHIRTVHSADLANHAIYVNGVLVAQGVGEPIDPAVLMDLLRELGAKIEEPEAVADDAVAEMGEFPTDYNDILREATNQTAKVNLEAVERYGNR